MVAVSSLITRVRRRANLEQSTSIDASEEFISDAEILDYLNEAGAELHEEMALSNENYLLSTAFYLVAAGASSFDLPSDFLKIKSVAKKTMSAPDGYFSLKEYDLSEENDFPTAFFPTTIWVYADMTRWNLFNTTIQLLPSNQAPGTYRVRYIPQYSQLASDSTVSHPDNWSDIMVISAAIQCRIKENIGSTQELENQLAKMKRRLTDAMARRGQAKGTRDVRSRRFYLR